MKLTRRKSKFSNILSTLDLALLETTKCAKKDLNIQNYDVPLKIWASSQLFLNCPSGWKPKSGLIKQNED